MNDIITLPPDAAAVEAGRHQFAPDADPSPAPPMIPAPKRRKK